MVLSSIQNASATERSGGACDEAVLTLHASKAGSQRPSPHWSLSVQWNVVSRRQPPPNATAIRSATTRSGSVPANRGDATPTTVNGDPLSRRSFPTT